VVEKKFDESRLSLKSDVIEKEHPYRFPGLGTLYLPPIGAGLHRERASRVVFSFSLRVA
jgi:hypothetical protein